LPFSYCFERLLFAASTIRDVYWNDGVFGVSFLGLVLVQSGVPLHQNTPGGVLAFLILSLALAVIALILGKFDRLLLEQKMLVTGLHEDASNLENHGTCSGSGISNIRRRPQRCFLTAATIVLVTFTLLSFTSLIPETSISVLRHPKGTPEYKGLLARDRGWLTSTAFVPVIERTFEEKRGRWNGIGISFQRRGGRRGSCQWGNGW